MSAPLRQYSTAAAVLLVLLAGCTAPAPGPAAPPSSSTAPTRAPSTTLADEARERLRTVLLTAADVGAGYATGPEPAPAPLPCGGDVAAEFPGALRVGVSLRDAGAVVEVRQAVAVYADSRTARAAFDATRAGMGCGAGPVDGAPARISPEQDLGEHVTADRATGWQVDAGARDLLVVAVQAGPAVVLLQYAAPGGTGLAERPDALGLTRTAVDRLLSA